MKDSLSRGMDDGISLIWLQCCLVERSPHDATLGPGATLLLGIFNLCDGMTSVGKGMVNRDAEHFNRRFVTDLGVF